MIQVDRCSLNFCRSHALNWALAFMTSSFTSTIVATWTACRASSVSATLKHASLASRIFTKARDVISTHSFRRNCSLCSSLSITDSCCSVSEAALVACWRNPVLHTYTNILPKTHLNIKWQKQLNIYSRYN